MAKRLICQSRGDETVWLLLWGWMPAGIGWQLLNFDRLDAYSLLGWFVWPAAPAVS